MSATASLPIEPKYSVQDSFFFKIAKPLIDIGIPVIPLRPKTKIAFLPGWEELASTDQAQIEAWAEAYPNSNCGAVAQSKPGGVWFWELDNKSVAKQYTNDTGLKLPKTYRVRSRPERGHLYFRHNDLSLKMLSNIAQNFVKGAGFSVRTDREYVVAASELAGSIHPTSGKPYEVVSNAPIIEADETTIKWLLAQKLDQKSAGTTDPGQPILSGKRNDALASIGGSLRQKGLTPEAIEAALQTLNVQRCEPPLDRDEVHTIAFSVGRYEVKPVVPCILGGKDLSDPANAPAQIQVNSVEEIVPVTFDPTPYPVFPDWVMKDTSIYEGFVKPVCDVNSRYPEFMFMPALLMLMNYIGGRVYIAESQTINGESMKRNLIPSIFLVMIGRKGRVIKSSSARDAIDYFKAVGLADWASPHMKNADGKSLVWSVGSPEGFGLEMSRLACNNGILFYDELAQLTKKASIESSSLGNSLLTLYESNLFANTIKRKNEAYVLPPGSYCASLIACTTDQNFHANWSKLAGDSSGLDERFFFLYQPPVFKKMLPQVTVSTAPGVALTKQRIEAAVQKGTYRIFDPEPLAQNIDALGLRAEIRAEKFALAFAVDLGRAEIDEECIERGLALSKYEIQTKNWLKTFESTTREGDLQQRILHKLRQENGVVTVRKLEHDLRATSHGTSLWGQAIKGLIQAGWIAPRGAGKRGSALEYVLIRKPEADNELL